MSAADKVRSDISPINFWVFNIMQKIEISVDADQNIGKVFKLLKQFEPGLELGPTMKAIRDQSPVLCREFGGIHSDEEFTQILALIDAVSSAGIRITLTHVERQPSTSIKDQPSFVKSIVNRDDILTALKNAAAIAEEQTRHAARMQGWLVTEDGQRYTAFHKRLSFVRTTMETRWEKLGNDNLTDYERDYINVWCLCVEVDNGGFHQYFSNSDGDNALLTLSALESITAIHAGEVLSDALSVFEDVGGFQAERPKRLECLKVLPKSVFRTFDERFYNLDEDIRSLALLNIERGYTRDAIPVETAG